MKTQIKSPKLVIIGAGSIFFTRAVAIGMCKDPCFKNGVLSLVDINPDILDVMKRLCQRIIRETGANLTLEATTNRRVALKNAQFVTLSFSNRGVDLREIETKIPAAFGVRQSSGDTIGPGGLFRSIRTIPTVLEIARDIEKICPEAWVFNYVNPTTVIGAALFRHTRLKTLALCDGFRLPDSKLALLDRVGVARAKAGKVTMKIGGLNHFNWVTDFRLGKKDLMPTLLRSLKAKPEPYANRAVMQVLEACGWYSMLGGHMVEFLPHFQGHGSNPKESYVNGIFEIDERRKWMKSFNAEIRRQADGKESIDKLVRDTKPDLIIQIADSILKDAGDVHLVNVPNHGYIANLPEGAVVEVPARIYRDRYEAEVVGEMPPVLRSWLLRVVDVQELTLEAAMTGNRRALRQALLADPMTVSFEDADHIIAALFKAEAKDVPSKWRVKEG